ncbi:MAG: PadR family transcriptional regulator [Acidobacteria bacterium]|nr:PadR family transcriptional regulator [Acidobacteriota bacterium]
MARDTYPRELEQTVLLALAAEGSEAQGGQVYDRIVETTGRDLSLAAVYITLTRLEEKGWAEVRAAAPAAGQGGKPRKFYRLSEAGGLILNDARERFDALWRDAAGNPLVRRAE